MRTSYARYECMGILYHELVAFIPNTKDIWDFCFWWLKLSKNISYRSLEFKCSLGILKNFTNYFLLKEAWIRVSQIITFLGF
ncbi:hypothetical protein DDP48_06830 [Helicobacter pylori]|nr:hypothetical protein DDP48_06830 [Helicobacter pylori]